MDRPKPSKYPIRAQFLQSVYIPSLAGYTKALFDN